MATISKVNELYHVPPMIRYTEGVIDGSQIDQVSDELLQQIYGESDLSIISINSQIEEAYLHSAKTPIDQGWLRDAKIALGRLKYQKNYIAHEIKKRKGGFSEQQNRVYKLFADIVHKEMPDVVYNYFMDRAVERMKAERVLDRAQKQQDGGE